MENRHASVTHGIRLMALLALAVIAMPAMAIKPMPPVEVSISSDAQALTADHGGTVAFEATPETDIERAWVGFEVVNGDVVLTGPATIELGRVAANTAYHAESTIQIGGQGASEVRGTFHALDAAGNELFWRSAAVLIAVSGDQVATGTDGLIPVELSALEKNSAAKASQESYDAEVHRIKTGGAAETKYSEPSGAKAGNVTVSGHIYWTDNLGTTHPARYVDVEIRDDNVISSELVTTVQTGADGSYSSTFENSDTFGTGGRDLFIRAFAKSIYAHLVSVARDDYYLESSITNDVADGTTLTIDLTANNTDDNNRAFSVQDALVTIKTYSMNVLGVSMPSIDTVFPTNKSTSLFDGTDLHILRDDWIDWDVMHHEFGHYFMKQTGIEDNPGGKHSSSENLAERVGKDKGIRLAWGEGYPTYFGTSGQLRMGASALNVPNVGDTAYTDTIDASINYDLENNAAPVDMGEDNELTVQRVLFDLYDGNADGNDKFSLGDYSVFSTARTAGAKTLSQFWNALIASSSMQEKVKYGALFMDHKVSPEPKAPADGASFAASDPPPAFDWEKRGAGPTYLLNKFTVEFWNEDFTTMYFASPEVDGPPWTPSNADWATIMGSGPVIKWVVKGRNTSAPETGTYISPARTLGGVDIGFVIDDTGSMSEEIGGVRDALTAFITALAGTPDKPTINLITFKDNVTSRIISDDLSAIQAQVNSLFASGGGDCPEASVEALELAATNVKAGGRLLFATDADPHSGLDIASTIAALRAKGLRVDVLLTGSCSESFKSGTYYTKSTGEQFYIPPQCNSEDCAGWFDEPGPKMGDVECDGPDCNTPLVPPQVFPTGAIVVFSGFAAETGGTFAFVPELNSGDPSGITRFNNVALNIMKGVVFPTLPDVNPPRGNRAATINLTIRGSNSNFNASSALSFSGEGITVNSGGPVSASEFEANITIAADAELGFRDMTIETALGGGDTETCTGTGIFEVEDLLTEPTITSVLPASGVLGDTLDVTITAVNTHFDAGSVADFGSGVTVNSFTPSNETTGVANITIDTDTDTLGYHSVSVSTMSASEFADENVVGPFLVTSAALSEGIPRIVSLSPSSAGPGTSVKVTATGEHTHFVDGESVGAVSGAGVTVTSTKVNSETEAELNLTIAPSAAHGFRDVTVTTGSEVAAILDGLEIANQPPTANAGPDQTVQTSGSTAMVTLDGSGSSDVDGTVAEYLWSGTPDPDDVAKPVVSLAPGTYTFTLVVKDADGASSAPDTVTIEVKRKRWFSCSGTTPSSSIPPLSGDALLLAIVAGTLIVARGRMNVSRSRVRDPRD